MISSRSLATVGEYTSVYGEAGFGAHGAREHTDVICTTEMAGVCVSGEADGFGEATAGSGINSGDSKAAVLRGSLAASTESDSDLFPGRFAERRNCLRWGFVSRGLVSGVFERNPRWFVAYGGCEVLGRDDFRCSEDKGRRWSHALDCGGSSG